MNCSQLKNLKFLNWNANGLSKQENIFRNFLFFHEIQIACVTETHFHPSDKFKIPGFNIYRNDRPSYKAAGGVAIIIRKELNHSQIECPTSDCLETIAINLKTDDSQIIIITAYKPPNKKFPVKTLNKIFNSNNNLMYNNNKKKIIIIGDLNSKNKAWNCNTTTEAGRKLLQFAQNHNILIHAPSTPTRYPFNNKGAPDILDISLSTNINCAFFSLGNTST